MTIMAKVFAALSPLVPGPDADGAACCYPNSLPEGPTYPAIAFQFISNTPAAALTQLARFSDFLVQVSLHDRDYDHLLALRAQVLLAVEAMPEYITRENDTELPFQFEPKVFTWILGFHLRDAES